jgi:hypothetical protein
LPLIVEADESKRAAGASLLLKVAPTRTLWFTLLREASSLRRLDTLRSPENLLQWFCCAEFSRVFIRRDFVIRTDNRPLGDCSKSHYSKSRTRIFVTWLLNCLSSHSRCSVFLIQAMNSLIGYEETVWERSTTTRITEWVTRWLLRFCI